MSCDRGLCDITRACVAVRPLGQAPHMIALVAKSDVDAVGLPLRAVAAPASPPNNAIALAFLQGAALCVAVPPVGAHRGIIRNASATRMCGRGPAALRMISRASL